MKIVSENSSGDLARTRASEHFRGALVDLTANLLRVTRGAGKGFEVAEQAASLVQAVRDYQRAHGHFPPALEYQKALSIEEKRDAASETNQMRQEAIERIVRAGLQVAASRLLGQRTQETSAEHDIFVGVDEVQAWRAEVNRELGARPKPRHRTPTRSVQIPK
mgnify:CR=1 FL=1